jgi:hypothetical protein
MVPPVTHHGKESFLKPKSFTITKENTVKSKVAIGLIALMAVLLLAACTTIQGKSPEVTGELGSPSATTTISGKQLPAPDPEFGGVIKKGALDSTPWWAPRIVPPKRPPTSC